MVDGLDGTSERSVEVKLMLRSNLKSEAVSKLGMFGVGYQFHHIRSLDFIPLIAKSKSCQKISRLILHVRTKCTAGSQVP